MNGPQHTTLKESYSAASRMAMRSGSSFYSSFWLLPAAKRRAMCVVYAFARITDDVADGTLPGGGSVAGGGAYSIAGTYSSSDRCRWLILWRAAIENAWHERSVGAGQGGVAESLAAIVPGRFNQQAAAILPAIVDVVLRYDIELPWLLDIIDGAISDQSTHTFQTYAQLDRYCHQVASTIGLICLSIWGYHNNRARSDAIDCGKAFQLTNILRDLREDLLQGRCYLPVESLTEHGVDVAMLTRGLVAGPELRTVDVSAEQSQHDAWQSLLMEYCGRADTFYQIAWRTIDGIDDDGKPMFAMMWHSYHELLCKIQRDPMRVFAHRIRLDPVHKLRIAATHFRPVIAGCFKRHASIGG